jgi:hypothetical protein
MADKRFKASDKDWQAIEALAECFGNYYARTITELRYRVAALEAAGRAEQGGTPKPNQAPVGDERLVDTIADIIGNEPIIGRPCPAAESVILAVAKWLRRVGNNGSADELEREAQR